MMQPENGIYMGEVVHKRLRPRVHKLKYRVFTLFADVDELDALASDSRLFSRNRFNLFSLYDRDHGDGQNLPGYLRTIADQSGYGDEVCRFMVLCYPRMLGYGFNPLTTYYGLDSSSRVRLMIYEVNNTFGGRHSYVIAAEPNPDGLVSQNCEKRLYVSPFNNDRGSYTFHVTQPGEFLTLGVTLGDDAGPLMRAHFRGRHRQFSDRALLGALASTGWLSLKVIAAIHFEALKLWAKGMRLVPRPPSKPASTTYVSGSRES